MSLGGVTFGSASGLPAEEAAARKSDEIKPALAAQPRNSSAVPDAEKTAPIAPTSDETKFPSQSADTINLEFSLATIGVRNVTFFFFVVVPALYVACINSYCAFLVALVALWIVLILYLPNDDARFAPLILLRAVVLHPLITNPYFAPGIIFVASYGSGFQAALIAYLSWMVGVTIRSGTPLKIPPFSAAVFERIAYLSSFYPFAASSLYSSTSSSLTSPPRPFDKNEELEQLITVYSTPLVLSDPAKAERWRWVLTNDLMANQEVRRFEWEYLWRGRPPASLLNVKAAPASFLGCDVVIADDIPFFEIVMHQMRVAGATKLMNEQTAIGVEQNWWNGRRSYHNGSLPPQYDRFFFIRYFTKRFGLAIAAKHNCTGLAIELAARLNVFLARNEELMEMEHIQEDALRLDAERDAPCRPNEVVLRESRSYYAEIEADLKTTLLTMFKRIARVTPPCRIPDLERMTVDWLLGFFSRMADPCRCGFVNPTARQESRRRDVVYLTREPELLPFYEVIHEFKKHKIEFAAVRVEDLPRLEFRQCGRCAAGERAERERSDPTEKVRIHAARRNAENLVLQLQKQSNKDAKIREILSAMIVHVDSNDESERAAVLETFLQPSTLECLLRSIRVNIHTVATAQITVDLICKLVWSKKRSENGGSGGVDDGGAGNDEKVDDKDDDAKGRRLFFSLSMRNALSKNFSKIVTAASALPTNKIDAARLKDSLADLLKKMSEFISNSNLEIESVERQQDQHQHQHQRQRIHSQRTHSRRSKAPIQHDDGKQQLVRDQGRILDNEQEVASDDEQHDAPHHGDDDEEPLHESTLENDRSNDSDDDNERGDDSQISSACQSPRLSYSNETVEMLSHLFMVSKEKAAEKLIAAGGDHRKAGELLMSEIEKV